jgi:hypothetical protein
MGNRGLRGWTRICSERVFMSNQIDRIHWDLSEQIIGSAMAVLNELGPGLDEKLYENALIVEIDKPGEKG